MATEMRAVQGVIYNPIHDVLHCAIGGLQPDSYVQAKEYEATEQIAERVRMRYVAATRARDLIVFPQHLGKLSKCWYTEMDLRIGQLSHFECESDAVGSAAEPVTVNQQSSEVFLQEATEISKRTREVEWHHPSSHELEEPTDVEPPNETTIDIEKFNIRGSAARGCVLHKLMEELLTKELIRDELAIQIRASTLLTQLGEQDHSNPGSGPSSQEIRDTVLRTVALPLVAKHFAQLLPEFRCYAASEEAGKFNGFAGTIDAVVLSQTQSAEFVFDWKSDVAPAAKIQEEHAAQVQAYLNMMDIPRGAVVYMTSGQIREVVR
jgi:ATP-dependent exoDNAse (exonuclease V) beta subunit